MKGLLFGLMLKSFLGAYVVEDFVVEEVNHESFHAEIVESNARYYEQGEGVFYFKDQHEEFENLQVGDKIKIIWTEENYYNENWEVIESVQVER